MARIEFDDPKFHVEIVSAQPISLSGTEFKVFLNALTPLNLAIPSAHLKVEPSGTDFTYALTLGDGRFYNAILRPTMRQRAVISTEFFTLGELLNHNPLVEAVFGLVDRSTTSLEVTWV